MAELVSGEAVVLDVPCARFPSRIIALIIDILVQAALAITVAVWIAAASVHLNPDSALAVVVSSAFLIIVGYPVIFETLSRGRSLGKLALGLRVVSDDGGPERFRQALVRGLASLVEIWMFTGAPALICSMVSARGKRLGDLFAGTFVIQERLPRRAALPPLFAVIPPPLTGWAQMLELSGLQDHTAEQAASYLRRFAEFTPAAREELGQRIAAAVASQVTPPPPPGTPPSAFLAAVLAVRRQREAARLATQQAAAAPAQPPGPYAAQYPPAQYLPAQYPPAQYPPAQYLPAQYPPAQYPPAQYPPAQQPAGTIPSAPPPSAPLGAPPVSGQRAPETQPPGSGGFAPPL